MIEESREQALARRVIEAGILKERALHWENRYRGCAKADELEDRGNFALLRIVKEFKQELGAFDDYARRRIDWAMLTGIRVEARRKRLDWAAQRATADLLATWRGDPQAPPPDELRGLLDAVATATFVAATQEALRGGEDDVVTGKDYSACMRVIAETLAELPNQQKRLMVLNFEDGKPLGEIAEKLGIHRNTAENWRKKVLAAIKAKLVKLEILQAPRRGIAARVSVLEPLRDPDDAKIEAANDGDGDGGDGDKEDPGL